MLRRTNARGSRDIINTYLTHTAASQVMHAIEEQLCAVHHMVLCLNAMRKSQHYLMDVGDKHNDGSMNNVLIVSKLCVIERTLLFYHRYEQSHNCC